MIKEANWQTIGSANRKDMLPFTERSRRSGPTGTSVFPKNRCLSRRFPDRRPPSRAARHRALLLGRIGGNHTQFRAAKSKISPEFSRSRELH